MADMDEREWLSHPKTGGFFHCPAAAVDDWIDMGWQKSDPPEETNPVVAENLAMRAAQAAAETKPAKPARRGETQE